MDSLNEEHGRIPAITSIKRGIGAIEESEESDEEAEERQLSHHSKSPEAKNCHDDYGFEAMSRPTE